MSVTLDMNSIISLLGFALSLSAGFVAWGRLNTDIDYVKTQISEIKGDLKELQKDFSNSNGRIGKLEVQYDMFTQLAKANSPLKLTDKGKKILEGSGGKTYVDKYCQELIDKIKSKNPETAYDVQAIAREVTREIEDEVEFKEYAFENGI